MKKIITVLALAVLGFAADPKTVSVTGSASVSIVPDTVSFSLAASNLAPNLNDAVSKTKETLKGVTIACKKHGVSAQDLQTGYINIQKEYSYATAARKFLGYRASQDLKITYRDLDKFESFSKDLLAFNVSVVSGFEFSSTKLKEYQDEASLMALEDAQQKAQKMAQKLGVKLTGVLHVRQNGDDEASAGVLYAAQKRSDYAQESSLQLNLGKLTITKSVYVIFEIQ